MKTEDFTRGGTMEIPESRELPQRATGDSCAPLTIEERLRSTAGNLYFHLLYASSVTFTAAQVETEAWLLDEAADAISALRETNGRLNRRCQSAEAALNMRVEDWNKRSTDAIRNHYYARYTEAEKMAAGLLAALKAADQFLDPEMSRGPSVNGWQNTRDLVTTAIAKAEGR